MDVKLGGPMLNSTNSTLSNLSALNGDDLRYAIGDQPQFGASIMDNTWGDIGGRYFVACPQQTTTFDTADAATSVFGTNFYPTASEMFYDSLNYMNAQTLMPAYDLQSTIEQSSDVSSIAQPIGLSIGPTELTNPLVFTPPRASRRGAKSGPRNRNSKIRTTKKPKETYIELIKMSIRAKESGHATLAEIYEYLGRFNDYFLDPAYTGWKNSIRHNLSLNNCFKKIAKETGTKTGKGAYWTIDETAAMNEKSNKSVEFASTSVESKTSKRKRQTAVVGGSQVYGSSEMEMSGSLQIVTTSEQLEQVAVIPTAGGSQSPENGGYEQELGGQSYSMMSNGQMSLGQPAHPAYGNSPPAMTNGQYQWEDVQSGYASGQSESTFHTPAYPPLYDQQMYASYGQMYAAESSAPTRQLSPVELDLKSMGPTPQTTWNSYSAQMMTPFDPQQTAAISAHYPPQHQSNSFGQWPTAANVA